MGINSFLVIIIIVLILLIRYQKNSDFFQNNKNNKLCIIVTTYNPGIEYIDKCLKSIEQQNYKNYDVCILDDASNKDRKNIINTIKYYCHKNNGNNGNWKYRLRKDNIGPLGGRIDAINALKPNDEDIIISIDGDDELYDHNVFDKVNSYYNESNCLITFGTFLRKYSDNKIKRSRLNCKRYDLDEIARNNTFRKTPWMYSHLKTFKYKLYKNIDHKDLKKNGEYLRSATDVALMYPMLEMSNGRFKCVSDVLYIYNHGHPESNHNIENKFSEQSQNAKYLKNQPAYKPMIFS